MSFRDSLFLPFEHYLPLELSNRAKDRQHHFSGRAGSVEIHVQNAEPNILGLQRVDDPARAWMRRTTRSAARRPQSPFLAFRATNNIANESVTVVAVHPGSAVGRNRRTGVFSTDLLKLIQPHRTILARECE
jgi:hypothetical protein